MPQNNGNGKGKILKKEGKEGDGIVKGMGNLSEKKRVVKLGEKKEKVEVQLKKQHEKEDRLKKDSRREHPQLS